MDKWESELYHNKFKDSFVASRRPIEELSEQETRLELIRAREILGKCEMMYRYWESFESQLEQAKISIEQMERNIRWKDNDRASEMRFITEILSHVSSLEAPQEWVEKLSAKFPTLRFERKIKPNGETAEPKKKQRWWCFWRSR